MLFTLNNGYLRVFRDYILTRRNTELIEWENSSAIVFFIWDYWYPQTFSVNCRPPISVLSLQALPSSYTNPESPCRARINLKLHKFVCQFVSVSILSLFVETRFVSLTINVRKCGSSWYQSSLLDESYKMDTDWLLHWKRKGA